MAWCEEPIGRQSQMPGGHSNGLGKGGKFSKTSRQIW